MEYKYCKNNLTFGRQCPCGFRKLPEDYFFDNASDKMSEYCHVCREEIKEEYRRWAGGSDSKRVESGRIKSPSRLDKRSYSRNIKQDDKSRQAREKK